MYVGRIVAIGKTTSEKVTALYRVSSRSFPNREAKVLENAVAILPKPGFEDDIHRNPYIAYNCLRTTERYGIVSNGTHTDHIANKIAAGQNMRDALAGVLHNMDFEHDSLDTPRIAAIVDREVGNGYLGIVRRNALHVAEFELAPGTAFYVATYEHNVPCGQYTDAAFDVADAADACQYVIGKGAFANLERPITAACLVETTSGWDVAVADVPQG